ncbi:hypothetical protein [Hahella ganghwensis]|uniref:hypothetical protein n=1 Tax=Hahella ganghwensis TaxID=286420 RepID=UPI00036F881D|nr:hypothetical protein [Hahella ganghwensis]
MSIDARQPEQTVKIKATYTPPPDFSEGGREYRRNILGSSSLIAVLLFSDSLKPAIFGVELNVLSMWVFLGVAHVYFFIMWRLTTSIANDKNGEFWNLKGIWRQAGLIGAWSFDGKTKAQLLFIRALPIWAFLLGLAGILWGLFQSSPAASI